MSVEMERAYWDEAAEDPDLDAKYIGYGVANDELFIQAVGEMYGRVLDLGCGVGRLMKPGYDGCDISEKMIRIAKKRQPDCTFKVCDGRNIPYDDQFLDSIYSVLMFQHIPLEAKIGYIVETARVLKGRGKLRFQFVEGTYSDGVDHNATTEQMGETLRPFFGITEIQSGYLHPQWTWITAVRHG